MSVDRVHNDQLQRFISWQRKIEKRIEAKEESNRRAEEAKESYFDSQSLEHSDDNVLKSQEFRNYIFKEQNIKALQQEMLADSAELPQRIATYLAQAEVEVLFDFFDEQSNLKLDKADELLQALLSGEDDVADSTLDGFINQNALTLSEIYVVLSYLYEEIAKRDKKRKKLLSLIMALIAKMEQQNSAHLLEFFSLVEHPTIKKNPQLAQAAASLAGGDINASSLQEGVNFVVKYLDGDFKNLVSKIIRLRTGLIKRLTKPKVTFEDKSELDSFIKFETNLMRINSIYLKLDKFKQSVDESKVWNVTVRDDFAGVIRSLLSFAQMPVVTEAGLKTLLSGLGIIQNLDQLLGFRNKLIQLLEGMPLEVFNNMDTHKQKIIQGLRNTLVSNAQNSKQKVANFSFIRRDKEPPKYV